MEHLDYDTLNTLKQVMDDDFALLIDTFVQDSTSRISTLREIIQREAMQNAIMQGTARQSPEADLIRRAAHSLKGSSSNIGALQLSALCSAVERKALANVIEGLTNDLDGIEQEFAKVQSLLRSYS